MRSARKAELRRDRLGDVGEARPRSDRAGGSAGAEGKNRHMLAGMVEPAEGRIVAVVGGDDAKV